MAQFVLSEPVDIAIWSSIFLHANRGCRKRSLINFFFLV